MQLKNNNNKSKHLLFLLSLLILVILGTGVRGGGCSALPDGAEGRVVSFGHFTISIWFRTCSVKRRHSFIHSFFHIWNLPFNLIFSSPHPHAPDFVKTGISVYVLDDQQGCTNILCCFFSTVIFFSCLLIEITVLKTGCDESCLWMMLFSVLNGLRFWRQRFRGT